MDLILASIGSPNPEISTKLALRRSRELAKVHAHGPASHSTTSRRRMDPFRVLGQVGLGSDSPQPSPWRERRAAVMSTHGCSLEACFLRAIGFPLWGLFLGPLPLPVDPASLFTSGIAPPSPFDWAKLCTHWANISCGGVVFGNRVAASAETRTRSAFWVCIIWPIGTLLWPH